MQLGFSLHVHNRFIGHTHATHARGARSTGFCTWSTRCIMCKIVDAGMEELNISFHLLEHQLLT